MKFPNCAIPLYVPKSDRITHIGTGFLASRRGEVGVVTTAHLPIGIKPFATAGWVGWPHEVLAAPDPTGSPLTLQMFAPGSDPKEPSFAYSLRNPVTGFMHDMIGFFGPLNAPTVTALQEDFDVIDLEAETPEPTKGAALTAVGYPDRGGATTWPYASPRRTSGPFERVADDGLLEAAFTPADGLLGAPVFADSGQLVGMVVGGDDGSARIHPRGDLLNL